MTKPHIVILGAGPAGLGAAYKLSQTRQFHVTVVEQNGRVGGNAGSFELAGLPVDYGSHRLHPSCPPNVLEDIRSLLGDDLLDRPRHGRIRLRGRWIHFPLKPIDLALRLPPAFAVGVIGDMAGKALTGDGSTGGQETFASVMERSLGRTICRDFYFPYARKIWGAEPGDLSAVQARRRVSNNSLTKMVKKIGSAIPGLKPKGSGRFFYPLQGYGQISDAYYQAGREAGAEFIMKAKVESLEQIQGQETRWTVRYEKDGQKDAQSVDHVWSTIPITILAKAINPPPPQHLLEAAQGLNYRAMILVYLVLEQDRFSEYDAHYFPGKEIAITRLSEPKNYSNRQNPQGVTVLCAELPCSIKDPEWGMSDDDLGRLVCQSLETAGIPVRAPVRQTSVRRLRQAYPIYSVGYEAYFDQLDAWLGKFENLLTFGRQGLFAHDNTHHALFMAYSAVECLDSGGKFNVDRWMEFRKIFETHVVED